MKKIYSIIALALVAASCSNLMEKDINPAAQNAVRFTSNIGAFATRATAEGFENGDRLGIFAGNPINADNVLYTFSGNTLTSTTPILWLDGQNDRTEFIAYYPYDKELSLEEDSLVVVSVAADQRSHEAYSRSDFLIAGAYTQPGETVNLEFGHLMSRVDISIPEPLAASVSSVALSGVLISYRGDGKAFNEAAVTAAEITDASGDKVWSAIIVPQASSPSLVINCKDGSSLTYPLGKKMEFESGKRYQAQLSLKEDGSLEAEFVFRIFDWLEGDWVYFGNYAVKWSVIGNFTDWSWDYTMEEAGSGIYTLELVLPEEAEFKFRRDGSWDINLGGTVTDADAGFRTTVQPGQAVSLIQGGTNLYYPQGGRVQIELNTNENYAVITQVVLDGDWSVIGSIQGRNWDYDIPMFQCYESGGYYALIYYREGEEFKLRLDGSWEVNRGIDSYGATGGFRAVPDGPNIVLPGEGVYEIFFYPNDEYIYIVPFGYLDSWGITGSLEGLEWNGDHFAAEAGPDDFLNPEVIFRDVVINQGEEFKIRFQQQWFFEYGYGADWNGQSYLLQPGVYYPLHAGGPNMGVSESGTYDIRFNLYGQTIVADKTSGEETPRSISIPEISDLVKDGTSSSPVSFEGIIDYTLVTYVNGNYAYLQDNSGSILLYQRDHGLNTGDIIKGYIYGSGYLYNGLPEITGIGDEYTLEGNSGQTNPDPTNLEDIYNYYDFFMSRLVRLTDVTVVSTSGRNGVISQNGLEIALYAQSSSVPLPAAGSIGNLTAIVSYYNGCQLAFWEEGWFEKTGEVEQEGSGVFAAASLSSLKSGDVIVLTSTNADGATYAMSNSNGTSSAPSAVAVQPSDSLTTVKTLENPSADLLWYVDVTDDGLVFYGSSSKVSWLYCTSSNNGVRVGTNTNNLFVIDSSSGYLVNSATSRYVGVYNGQDWRCYTSINTNIQNQSFTAYIRQ